MLFNFLSFKPYYKWITFNTKLLTLMPKLDFDVLNLIINGLPSILFVGIGSEVINEAGFKPYYKWITFNT